MSHLQRLISNLWKILGNRCKDASAYASVFRAVGYADAHPTIFKNLSNVTIVISIIFLLTFPTFAQADLDETYDWDIGISMDYASDWDVSVDDNDIVHFISDDTDVFIIFDGYDEDDSLSEYIEDAFDEYKFETSVRFDEDDVLIDDLGDFDDTASYFYIEELNDDEFERAIFAIPLDDETIAIAVAVPIQAEDLEEVDTVLAMLASFTGNANQILDDVSYEWDNGYEIDLDNDWQLDDDSFNNGTLSISISFFEVDDERIDTRASILRNAIAESDATFNYNEDQLYFIDLENDEDALEYDYNNGDYTTLIVSFSMDNDVIILATITPTDEDEDSVLDNAEDAYLFLETIE